MRKLKSLIIQSEDDAGDISEMLQGVLQGIQHNEPDINTEELYAWTKENVIIRKVKGVVGKDFCNLLRKLIDELKPDLVWINPLFAFAGCNLVDPKETSDLLRGKLLPIGEETGVAVGAVHHAGKTDRDSKLKSHWTIEDWQYLAYGTSEIQNPFRAICILVPTNDKTNDGRPIYKFILAKRGERAEARTPWDEPTREVFLVRATDGSLFWSQIEEPEKKEVTKSGKPIGRPRSATADELLQVLGEKHLMPAQWLRRLNTRRKKQERQPISESTFKKYRGELEERGEVTKDQEEKCYQVGIG